MAASNQLNVQYSMNNKAVEDKDTSECDLKETAIANGRKRSTLLSDNTLEIEIQTCRDKQAPRAEELDVLNTDVVQRKSDLELMFVKSSIGQPTSRNILNNGAPLKFIAIAFGLWNPLGCWSIPSLVIAIPIALFVFCGEALIVYQCRWDSPHLNESFCFLAADNSDPIPRTEFNFNQFIRFIIAASQVVCYLMMCFCIRRCPKRGKILLLNSAFHLVEKSKWGVVNLILAFFLVVPTSALLLQKCCPFGVACNSCDGKIIIWYILLSLLLWLTVVSCLVFATVAYGLATLARQCNERILTIEADSVNCYIAIHQDLCCTIATTVGAYKKWFIVNTACHCWVVLYFAVVLLTKLDNSLSWTSYYFIFVLIIYAVFVAAHPWVSTANLTREFNNMIRMLNTNTNWSPNHPLNDRSRLNDFVQYARNTQCQFSQISCSTALPFLSIFLALCGLVLRLLQ